MASNDNINKSSTIPSQTFSWGRTSRRTTTFSSRCPYFLIEQRYNGQNQCQLFRSCLKRWPTKRESKAGGNNITFQCSLIGLLLMGAPKRKWRSEEEEAIKAGVAKHGKGKWSTILKDPAFGPILHLRSNVDLRDKWRNVKAAVMSRAYRSMKYSDVQ